MKILLVEDSATLRHAMSQYIVQAGHTPVVASSGEEALQLLEITPVDMIIMDVEMPGLNGFETTRLIREGLGKHWVPIIFVTGLNDDENYREGIDAGGDDYLIKPVSYTIIQAKIRAMERITEMRDQLNRLNAELEALSQLDSLTQIYNRRTFNEFAQRQWLISARQQSPISLLMIDVDHFKLYNDHYGHPAGDACLKAVSEAIKNALHRPADLLGRYGGEEFIVLLPDTDEKGAEKVAELILQSIDQLAIAHQSSPSGDVVSVSIGGATAERTQGALLEELIRTADRSLYKAKRAGRHCAQVESLSTHQTVLIVDSSTDIHYWLTKSLQQQCNIVTSDNVQEAIEIAEDIKPDLVIIDAEFGISPNYRLCDLLANNPLTAHIPVLLLVCQQVPLNEPAKLPVNVCDFLAKHSTDEALMQKITALLN